MYKSPIQITVVDNTIETAATQMSEAINEQIYRYVVKMGVTVDKEELIKALAYDRGQYKAGYDDAMATLKRGRWVDRIMVGREHLWFCSECDTMGSPTWKCCPVCTAFMDGKGDNE